MLTALIMLRVSSLSAATTTSSGVIPITFLLFLRAAMIGERAAVAVGRYSVPTQSVYYIYYAHYDSKRNSAGLKNIVERSGCHRHSLSEGRILWYSISKLGVSIPQPMLFSISSRLQKRVSSTSSSAAVTFRLSGSISK